MTKSSSNLLVLLGAVAAPSLAAAFGLGEAQVQSEIGQPLDVAIPLALERSEALSKLRVELASPNSYIDAGLEWPTVLHDAAVSLEQSSDGRTYVRIRSKDRVMEPILPLLIEAQLGPMSLHRDYSVLLDLPAQAGGVGARSKAPVRDTSPIPFEAQAPHADAAPAPVAPAPAIAARAMTAPARASMPMPVTGGQATVGEGESLGTLAQRVRPDPSIPLRRMMLALYQANPDAFDGSMDRLWSGAAIRVPAAHEVPALAKAADPTPRGHSRGAPRAQVRITGRAVPAPAPLPAPPSQDFAPAAVAGRPNLTVSGSFALKPTRTLRLSETLANPPPAQATPAIEEPAQAPVVAPAEQPVVAVPPVVARKPGGLGFWWLVLAGIGAAWLASRFSIPGRIRDAYVRARAAKLPAGPASAEGVEPAVAQSAPAPPIPYATVPRARPVEIAPAEPPAAERLMTVAPATPEPAAAAATPPPVPAPAPAAPKIVPIKRREDPSIEVGEAPLHGATASGGSLNGFYADVAQMLTTALQQDPRRRDLRLKLLEVYFSAGLADDYLSQTRAYLDELKGQNDESWQDVASMGRQLVPGHEWFAMSTPPRISGAGDPQSRTTMAPKRNFNRYYEGVDQWRLRGALEDLEQQYKTLTRDPSFIQMQTELLQRLAGRPTLLVHAAALSQKLGGAQVYLKREPRHGSGDDHLINAIGQCALARRMNRKTVIAATSNGLHGLAVAAVAKSLGLECRVFMNDKDMRANYPRILRMRELGARIEDVYENPTLPGDADVRRAALTGWLENPKESLYISSLSSGPHPYPMITQDCQSVVGRELRAQLHVHSPRPPAAIVAGTADGPGVIGLLQSFLDETQTRMFCVESSRTGNVRDSMTVRNETPDLEFTEHNWPREHNWLKETRRVTYAKVTEQEAILAMQLAYETEKLMLSQQGAQVVAYAGRVAREFRPDQTVVVLLPSQNDADARLTENASQRQIRMDVV